MTDADPPAPPADVVVAGEVADAVDELVVVVARGLAEVWELDVDELPPHAATPTPTRTALRASAGLDRARWRGARWRRARWRTPGLVMTVCKLCSFGRSLCSCGRSG